MGTITVPLSLGNVGIIETDGGFFPSFLNRPREEGTFESRNSRREK